MSSSDAALLQEIQRLTGAIDRHKNAATRHATYRPYPTHTFANKKYVNPAIASKDVIPQGSVIPPASNSAPSSSNQQVIRQPREVVIDGITFESSHRKLTRLDSKSTTFDFAGPSRKLIPRTLVTKVNDPKLRKPKYLKRKYLGGRNNLVLDNVKGTRTGKLPKAKKQCRFFTMTGECQRGRTCRYQHDPEKIAICPLFLSNTCPNTVENCRLSHDPTPSRVPLCHHFSNHGRCTREICPYPHIRVGPRSGVCRDFAVVGYCDKGIDCDKQHVRECPDFAEKGSCPNKSCKLPHVIRANMRRKHVPAPHFALNTARSTNPSAVVAEAVNSVNGRGIDGLPFPSTVENSSAAEEFISLTFEESEDESDDDEGSQDESDSVASEDVVA